MDRVKTAKDVAEYFYNQWENSDGHYENMINDDITLGAVGVINKNGEFYATFIGVRK